MQHPEPAIRAKQARLGYLAQFYGVHITHVEEILKAKKVTGNPRRAPFPVESGHDLRGAREWQPAAQAGTISTCYWPHGVATIYLGTITWTQHWTITSRGSLGTIHSTCTGEPPVPARVPREVRDASLAAALDAMEEDAARYEAAGDDQTASRLRDAIGRTRARAPGAGPGRPEDGDLLRQVATVYNHALAQGRRPVKAVCEAFPYHDRRSVLRLIQQARGAGLITGRGRPGRPRKDTVTGS